MFASAAGGDMAPVCKHGGQELANWTVVITNMLPLPFLFYLSFVHGLESICPQEQGKRALSTGV